MKKKEKENMILRIKDLSNQFDELHKDRLRHEQMMQEAKTEQLEKQRKHNYTMGMIYLATIIMIGFFTFGIIIMSQTISGEISCSGTGINYDVESYIGVNEVFDVKEFQLNNSNVTCKMNAKMPVWAVNILG